MPATPVFGIPYEDPDGDQPGITLHGGIPPSSPISAEVIEAILVGHVADLSDLDTRLAAVEAAVTASPWRHIAGGTQSGGTDFAIAVPAGYERLRLTLVGDLDAQNSVNLRINGDTSNVYSRGFLAWDAAGSQDFAEFNATTSSWKVAEWSSVESNTVVVDVFPVDGSQNPSIQASSTQVATSDTTHRQEFGWGKYAGDVVVSSLNLFPGTGTWATARWWLEGYLAL